MPNGGTLTLGAEQYLLEEPDPLVEHLAHGDYVVLSVEDTGAGMDEEHRRQAFEPFFTTKPAGKGTGLGLTTVFKIVQQHAGHIEIESHVGKGTRFRIYLPATDSIDELSQSSDGEALDALPMSTTVLVADDEAMVRRTATRVLEGDGMEVIGAADGNQALRAYSEHGSRIKLVILDLDMPHLDGEGAHEILKGIDPDLKFLVCSGYLDDERERELAEAGVHGFLRKPYDAESLRTAVREVLADVRVTLT
jgi:CheY-like chemotaxis protein